MKASALVILAVATAAVAPLGACGRSKRPAVYPANAEWRGRFSEFHDAWQDYRSRDAFPGADTVESENRKLFPLHFEDLQAYGPKEGRKFLGTAEDFKEFQHSIQIDIENERYFEDQHIEPDSWLESQSVILHKDVTGPNDTKLKIVLTYGGDIFTLPR